MARPCHGAGRGSATGSRLALLAGALAVLLAGPGCAPRGDATADEAEVARRPDASGGPAAVTALGRLEPRNGIRRVAGPSRPTVVIARLLVDEGDRVSAGQPIAVLDSLRENEARAARAQVQVGNARRSFERVDTLVRQGVSSSAARDDAKVALDVAEADLAAARSAVDLDTVRAPVAGEIVAVHARSGERVGPDGIVEVAENDAMYAIAEVYETDVGRVAVGQRARLASPALAEPLTGSVDRIGRKVGRQTALDTDPIARTDARVVEVRIRVDDGARAAGLSNLQVEITLEPLERRG